MIGVDEVSEELNFGGGRVCCLQLRNVGLKYVMWPREDIGPSLGPPHLANQVPLLCVIGAAKGRPHGILRGETQHCDGHPGGGSEDMAASATL